MTMPLRCSLATLAAALAIAGCGGSQEAPDIPATAPAGKPLTIVAREYVLTPNRVTLRGADGPVRQEVALDNRGDLAHNIEILDGERIVARLRSFPAGERRAMTVRLPPGDYELLCTVADHEDKGMRGTLTIR